MIFFFSNLQILKRIFEKSMGKWITHALVTFFFFFFLKNNQPTGFLIYLFLFIYGCVESSFLCEGFL